MDKDRINTLAKRKWEDEIYYRKRSMDAQLRERKFKMWLGYDPIHNIETKELVGWKDTPLSKINCDDCWRNGESPWQRYNRLFVDT